MKYGAFILVLLLLAWGAIADDYDPDAYEVPTAVILLVREDALFAFSGVTGRWTSLDLAIGERLLVKKAIGNVAVAITNQRTLGYSGLTGFWAAEKLEVGESLEGIEIEGNVAAILTNKRVLGFSARTGTWVPEPLTRLDDASPFR